MRVSADINAGNPSSRARKFFLKRLGHVCVETSEYREVVLMVKPHF